MSKILFSIKTKLRLGILCLSTAYGAPLQAQSLEQAVAMALDSHPDIRQSFARFKSKEEDVNQARAGYLPTIDLTAGYGAEYSDTPGNRRSSLGFADQDTTLNRSELGISLRQMIFDGMFTQNEVARTQYEASAQQWALISTAEDLALSVSQAYLNYLKTAQLITLAEKNVSSHEVIYAQIKERTDSGLGSIADLSQISGRLARAQSNLIAARNNNEDARVQFIRLTNTTPKELVKPVPDADMLPNDASSGLMLAIERHPIIKSAQQDINAARSFKSTVNARYYPTIALELNANSDNNVGGESGINRFGADVGGDRNDLSAMVRLRYNFYAGGKDAAQSRSAAYKVSEAQEINYSAHRQVTESFRLSWSAYEMLALQKNYLKQHVVSSEETQVAYTQQFSLGQRNLLDLLDTENELFQASQNYMDADFDELSARYRLLNATGQLLDSLRVTRSSTWQGEHNYAQGANHE
jgi:adhesin transport system outer membrane protein